MTSQEARAVLGALGVLLELAGVAVAAVGLALILPPWACITFMGVVIMCIGVIMTDRADRAKRSGRK